jgi:hypothetical protein
MTARRPIEEPFVRYPLLKSCLLLPALCVAACGPTQLSEEPAFGEHSQPLLYPPPAPASGNIVDSTAFLGPLALGGAVQTQFTTNPQYLSFGFKVRAGAQVKLEVTHLGSSMYLDTGLFVYGPRRADGSWGTTLVAADDESGYGQLSKLASLSLPERGEYLAVVSTGTGAGKRFRLQLDCLNGGCDPAAYSPCAVEVGTRIEVCVQAKVEEPDPVLGRPLTTEEAYAACTGADDAHEAYVAVCGGGTGPEWCAGGEAPFTEQMWPVCQDYYKHYYGMYTLALTAQAVPSTTQSHMAAGNAQCDNDGCDGRITLYSFPWTSTATPRLDKAKEAVLATQEFGELFERYDFTEMGTIGFDAFIQQVSPQFASLDPHLLTVLGNPRQQVQVAHYSRYYDDYNAGATHNFYVLLFAQSHHVVVFQYFVYEL